MKKFHSKIWQQLERAEQTGQLSHAYLFTGPSGTGKFDLAIEFVCLLNKLDQKKEQVVLGNHPDVKIVRLDRQKNESKVEKKDITINQIKNAVQGLKYFSYETKYKVLVVFEAEKMNATAANSLLKILEEPKADTIIILIAHNENKVLPTLRSRCRIVRTYLADPVRIEKALNEKYTTADKALIEDSINFSRGEIKRAEAFLTGQESLSTVKQEIEIFKKALKGGPIEFLVLAEKMNEDKEMAIQSVKEWLWYLRSFLNQNIKEQVDMRVQKKIFQILKALLELYDNLSTTNVSVRIQLENFFLKIS